MLKIYSLCLLLMISSCKARHSSGFSAENKLRNAKPSLFEIIISHKKKNELPRSFEGMVDFLSEYGKPLGNLIPLGLSLQRTVAYPGVFKNPRRVVAFTSNGSYLDIGSKIYLGYVEGAGQIEVISYNSYTGVFDFLEITNINSDKAPTLQKPMLARCSACHHDRLPIYYPAPWELSNASGLIASLIKRHHSKADVDGIPIFQTMTESPGGPLGAEGYLFESVVVQSARLVQVNMIWRSLKLPDRVKIFSLALAKRLQKNVKIPADLKEIVARVQTAVHLESPIFPEVDTFELGGDLQKAIFSHRDTFNYPYFLPFSRVVSLPSPSNSSNIKSSGDTKKSLVNFFLDYYSGRFPTANIRDDGSLGDFHTAGVGEALTNSSESMFLAEAQLAKIMLEGPKKSIVTKKRSQLNTLVFESVLENLSMSFGKQEIAELSSSFKKGSLNMKSINLALTKVAKIDGPLNQEVFRPQETLDLLLKILGLNTIKRNDMRGLPDIYVPSSLGELDISVDDPTLKILKRHCGACHGLVRDPVDPAFLHGSSERIVCNKVKNNKEAIITSLTSSMPPRDAPYPLSVSGRRNLLDKLKSLACP